MKELQNLNSSNNNKILVVLPLNKVEDYLLNECLYSLAQQEYPIDLLILANNLSQEQKDEVERIATGPKIIVQAKNDKGEIQRDEVSALKDLNFTIVDSEMTTFNKIFNEGFNYALKNKYEFYSLVEYDDVVDVKWFLNVVNFSKDKKEIDGFMPLTKEVSNGAFLGHFNEACWMDGYAEVAGQFDLTLLTRFNCMNITGAAFKVNCLQKFSEHDKDNDYYKPIKESIKLGYIYEFFLRMIYKDMKFFTIPRFGYEHRIDRPTPMIDYFTSKLPRDLIVRTPETGGITSEENTFWNNLVKKEYYHAKDRNVVFEK